MAPKKEEMKKDKPHLLAEVSLSDLRKTNSIDVDLKGLHGVRQQLTLQYYSPEPDHPLHSDKPGGEAGNYRVVFTLCRPGFSLCAHDSYADAASLEGDSHLAIAKPAHPSPEVSEKAFAKLTATIDDLELTFTGHANAKGFLGKLVLESIEASNYSDAALKAYRGITFALSSMSFRYDIPLNIYQVDVIELRTGSNRMSVMRAFRETPFIGDSERLLTSEFLKYASYYREGLNSNSLSYQFLCFYKIIEGLRERRDRLIREAKAKGKPIPPQISGKIPADEKEQTEWLNAIFILPQEWDEMSLSSVFPSESLGRKISNLIGKESELNKTRHKIAHGVLDEGEPTLSIDDARDVELVNKWLPLTKCLARLMLNDAFPDRFPDKEPKKGKVKLYRSRSFSGQLVGDHTEYSPEPDSLEFVKEIETEIRDGKVTMPALNMDMSEQGIGMDSNGNPTVIFVAMEVHDDGSEHLLYTGYVHIPSSSFRMYGKRPHATGA